MKKILFTALSLLLLAACNGGEGNPPTEPQWLTDTRKMLVGSWHGERFYNALNCLDCEDIVFSPFDNSREIVSLFGTFEAYGTANVVQYRYVEQKQDTLSKLSIRCFYTLSQWGGDIILSFYRCDEDDFVVNREDGRVFNRISDTEFLMRGRYASTETTKTYKLQ